MATILVIDDDKGIVQSFKELFKNKHRVLDAYNSTEAFKLIKTNKIDLIFLDYRIPGEDGISILKRIKTLEPEIYVIFITGYGTIETTIKTISYGAYDYIEKPLDIDRIEIVTKRALESKKLNFYIKQISNEQINNYNFNKIIGKTDAMQKIYKQIGKLVNNDVTVLITGESGTGKELIARALHYNGNRKNSPFVAVNCSGLTETLLDNELFGHEAEAYTGANTRKIGKFEAAGDGTIFLDEIGDMPISIQSKLLRILQEKEFQRLGGNKTVTLKARIIVATNKNLKIEIKENRFRQDLFYRINVASIELPPLRKRKDDIPELIEYFINNANYKLKKRITGITKEALNILINYKWPGNIRELENVILNICINLSTNYIDVDNIPKYILRNENDYKDDIINEFLDKFLNKYSKKNNIYPLLINKLEAELIKKVGEKLNYNKTAMAKVLGISRVTLQKKLS